MANMTAAEREAFVKAENKKVAAANTATLKNSERAVERARANEKMAAEARAKEGAPELPPALRRHPRPPPIAPKPNENEADTIPPATEPTGG